MHALPGCQCTYTNSGEMSARLRTHLGRWDDHHPTKVHARPCVSYKVSNHITSLPSPGLTPCQPGLNWYDSDSGPSLKANLMCAPTLQWCSVHYPKTHFTAYQKVSVTLCHGSSIGVQSHRRQHTIRCSCSVSTPLELRDLQLTSSGGTLSMTVSRKYSRDLDAESVESVTAESAKRSHSYHTCCSVEARHVPAYRDRPCSHTDELLPSYMHCYTITMHVGRQLFISVYYTLLRCYTFRLSAPFPSLFRHRAAASTRSSLHVPSFPILRDAHSTRGHIFGIRS